METHYCCLRNEHGEVAVVTNVSGLCYSRASVHEITRAVLRHHYPGQDTASLHAAVKLVIDFLLLHPTPQITKTMLSWLDLGY